MGGWVAGWAGGWVGGRVGGWVGGATARPVDACMPRQGRVPPTPPAAPPLPAPRPYAPPLAPQSPTLPRRWCSLCGVSWCWLGWASPSPTTSTHVGGPTAGGARGQGGRVAARATSRPAPLSATRKPSHTHPPALRASPPTHPLLHSLYTHTSTEHHDLNSWEARCECIAGLLCCRRQVSSSARGPTAWEANGRGGSGCFPSHTLPLSCTRGTRPAPPPPHTHTHRCCASPTAGAPPCTTSPS